MLNPDPLHSTRTGRCDSVAAKQAWTMVTDEQIRDRLRSDIDKESLAMLKRIASGEPIRNAREVINAIKTQLSFGVAPPKQTIEMESRQTVCVIDPYAQPVNARTGTESLAEPPVVARPPVVRKKGALDGTGYATESEGSAGERAAAPIG